MSLVTDVVMILPWPDDDAQKRFEHLIADHLELHTAPDPKEEDFKSTSRTVYHLGANYMPYELRAALLTGPWPTGTVLLLENEASDARPIIKIFGPVPDGGWDGIPEEYR